jgi:peptidoglycan/LPS O-acetylase OafA/YrhL
VEYYLALPLLAALCGTLRRALVVGLLALVSHTIIAFLSPTEVAGVGLAWLLGFHLPALLVEFMLGTLAWCVVRHRPSSGQRVALLISGVLVWLAVANQFVALGDAGVLQSHWWRGNVGLFASVAYAMILAAWAGWIPRPAAWLLALATFFGDLSYGLYLFHNAMQVALAPLKSSVGAAWFAVICLLATAAVAQVMHVIWEAPWRRYGRAVAREIEAVGDRPTPQVTDR